MKKTINLFVDMDGTLAKFYYKKNYLEKMYEKGYFENLPLYAMANKIDAFAKLDSCVNVYILSACIDSEYCEKEKINWLLKNMPNIKPQNFVFTKVGESKLLKAKEKVANFDDSINVLLDDYTLNLELWARELNCIGIKFLNGLNDKTKSWDGYRVKNFSTLIKVLQKVAVFGNN